MFKQLTTKMILKLIVSLTIVLLLIIAVSKIIKLPVFNIVEVIVEGDIKHESSDNIANLKQEYLAKNIFLVDISEIKQTYESLPWIRLATVKRLFPNKIKITLHEHQVAAYWGENTNNKLLNTYAEIFEVDLNKLEDLKVPHLFGSEGKSKIVLQTYVKLKDLFKNTGTRIEKLEINDMSNWNLSLENGAKITIGKGDSQVVYKKVLNFLINYTKVITIKKLNGKVVLENADLRYTDGFALKLNSI